MARPSDPAIRSGILAACTQVAMAGHLGDLSLKQLSQSVGVSPRMLIYHFGSADGLIAETLMEVQRVMRRQLQTSLVQDQNRDAREVLRALWDHCASEEMVPFFRSYYYFIGESLGRSECNAAFIEFSIDGLRDWIKTCLAGHQPCLGDADCSVVSAVLRGLLIDRLATGDRRRTTGAFQAFLDGYLASLPAENPASV